MAIGQLGPFSGKGFFGNKRIPATEIQTGPQGCLSVDNHYRTLVEGLYAAGRWGHRSNHRGAIPWHRDVPQHAPSMLPSARKRFSPLKPEGPLDKDYPEIPQEHSLPFPTDLMPEQQPEARKDNFSEVAMGLSEPQVLFEAERCLQCGICSECFLCEGCLRDALGAIHHQDQPRETVEQAGGGDYCRSFSNPSRQRRGCHYGPMDPRPQNRMSTPWWPAVFPRQPMP